MKKLLLLIVLLWSFTLACYSQNFTTITATHIYGGGSQLLSSGTIVWQAVDSHDTPISYQVGGSGQQIKFPTICSIVNGAITGNCQVANTALTNPLNVCFDVKIKNGSNTVVLGGPGSGYQCVQPATTNVWCTAGVCNFDSFVPNLPGVITAILPPPTPATLGGVYAKNCSGATPLVSGYDSNGNPICASGSGGLNDPGAAGVVFRTTLDLTRVASGTDIAAAFSGCDSSNPTLTFDGTCKPLGNISSVVAGAGLSGGGSSGAVTLSLAAPQALQLGGVFAKSCSGPTPLVAGIDSAGNPICASGSAGLGDPGASGLVFRTTLNTTRIGVVSDLVTLFSGCSSGNPALGYNGTCFPLGSITGITAGTGLTGGGSSGNVTVSLANPIASNTTGNAATASALSGSPLQCPAGQSATGISANGNAQGCFVPAGSVPTGTGFFHVTGGVQDGAARAVNLAGADVSGTLPASSVGAGYNYSSLVGSPSALPPNGSAGGDLGGSYPNPTVNPINLASTLHGGVTGVLPAASVGAGYPYSSVTGTPSSLPPSGSASGDLSGSYPGPTVAKVNGAALPVSAALVGTNGSGQVVANVGTIANNTSGTASGFTGSLNGDVTGNQSATTVGKVNGAALPTSAALVGTNLSGQIVANVGTIANNTSGSAASFTGSLAGDATGTQSATVVSKVNGLAIPLSAALVGTNASRQFVVNSGTITNNTSGNAATATALAATPTQCLTGLFSTGITAAGNANCSAAPGSSAGLINQLQYSNGASGFAASSQFVIDPATGNMTIAGNMSAASFTFSGGAQVNIAGAYGVCTIAPLSQSEICFGPSGQIFVSENHGALHHILNDSGVDASLINSGVLTSARIPDLSALYIAVSQRGVGNGVAELDASTHVKVTQLGTNTPTNAGLFTEGGVQTWRNCASTPLAGSVFYYNGTAFSCLPGDNSGNLAFLSQTSGVPSWNTTVATTNNSLGAGFVPYHSSNNGLQTSNDFSFASGVLSLGFSTGNSGGLDLTNTDGGKVQLRTKTGIGGTVIQNFPTLAGTFATTAVAPVLLNSTTGAISIPASTYVDHGTITNTAALLLCTDGSTPAKATTVGCPVVSGGADTALDNLANPTAINQTLTFGSSTAAAITATQTNGNVALNAAGTGGVALGNAGTVTSPGLFANGVSGGLSFLGSNTAAFVNGTKAFVYFANGNYLKIPGGAGGMGMAWSSNASDALASTEVCWDGTGNNQIRLSQGCSNSSGTDTAAHDETIVIGLGTGAATPSKMLFDTSAAPLVSGAAVQSAAHRLVLGGYQSGLVSGSPTAVFTSSLVTLQMAGGEVTYTVRVTDGADMCAVSGRVEWSLVNKGGTSTGGVTAPSEVKAVSDGTKCSGLSTAWAFSGASLRVTPTLTGTMTPTSFVIESQIVNNGQATITAF